eukprot:GHVN01029263.1.p1 GENE.GHVN01029263.1~~GHVN01029263.1.p1  ORF type:complete len:321 (+),score=23.28 GHVN01029263.1:352-1314(+)
MIFYPQRFWLGIVIIFRVYGSVLPTAILHGGFAACITFVLMFFEIVPNVNGGTLMFHPAPFTFFFQVSSFVIAFHANNSYQRYWEARTRIQGMASSWCDAATQFIAFDELGNYGKKRARRYRPTLEGSAFRARLLHLISLLHATAMSYMLKRGADFEVLGGIDHMEEDDLNEVSDQPFFILHLINQCCSRRHVDGGLPFPAPILARPFNSLSAGMLEYNQACKLDDTPFPFPYQQLMWFIDWSLILTTPLVMACYISATVWGVTLTWLVNGCMHAIFIAACHMERPFGQRPNDLPFTELHQDYMNRLKSLIDIGTGQWGQ